MTRKSNRHKNEQKRINNMVLAVIALAAVIACTLFVMEIIAGQQKESWASIQAKALVSTLSGQQHGTLAEKPHLPETVEIPILTYHHVGYVPEGSEQDLLRTDLTVSPENFEMQVAWLKGQGFHSITLAELHRYTEGKFTLPDNPIIFTFDDGYADVFEYAAPILQQYGYAGSFAVITQFAGLKYGTNQYATWAQIREAQALGMDIISHTQDHFDGLDATYNDTFIVRNLADSQKDIAQNTSRAPAPVLVYPYGRYDDRYLSLAQQAGFRLGVTTNSGRTVYMNQLMKIPRLRVGGGQSLESFQKMILQ